MNLAIITVRRSPDYLYPSLLSLFTSGGFPGPAHLFVGSDDAEYLDLLHGNPRLTVHPMPAGDWAAIADWPVMRRFSYNYWRCLDHFAARGEGVCLCEDDVVYAEGFWGRLAEAVAEADASLGEYVLALYSYWDFGADPGLARGRHLAAYPAASFFGTQAVYYTPGAAAAHAAHLRDRGLGDSQTPGDHVIRDLCVARQDLYVTRASLVQHVGRVSTGLGYFHASPSFGRAGAAPREGE